MKTARETAARLGLIAASLALTLAGFELACRPWQGPHALRHWPNLVVLERMSSVEPCGYVANADFGWLPPANCTSPQSSYDARSFRHVPQPPGDKIAGPAVLATGDSFTVGEGVADDETWPAYLHALLGRNVVNAGVSGFGLDQTVLRTERLAAELRPAAIVMGFIADDLRRAEMSLMWGGAKPYFSLEGETLTLHAIATPPRLGTRHELGFWQRWLGWSMLVDTIVRRLGWQEKWFAENVRALPKGDGERLACPLMGRIAALGIPTLVVAEYELAQAETGYDRDSVAEQRRKSQIVLRCAERAGLATLDLFDTVDAIVQARGIDAIYRGWHHNAEGNRLVAKAIAAELTRRELLPAARIGPH